MNEYSSPKPQDAPIPSAEALDVRIRRLKFRAWHRGTREMDLIIGRFADAVLDGYGAAELALFETLLEENDPDIYNWITGREPPPARLDRALLQALAASTDHALHTATGEEPA